MTDIHPVIRKYFPELTPEQSRQFALLGPLYAEWNARINVVSRKDIDALYERHILHSLGIARVFQFAAGTHILDVGTGGGFPGIPLAILRPDCHFHLIDSIGKKINVVRAVVEATGLTNVTAEHVNARLHRTRYPYIVSRAVMPAADLFQLVRHNFCPAPTDAAPAALICLKGGDLTEELAQLPRGLQAYVEKLSDHFDEPFFETKKVVTIPALAQR